MKWKAKYDFAVRRVHIHSIDRLAVQGLKKSDGISSCPGEGCFEKYRVRMWLAIRKDKNIAFTMNDELTLVLRKCRDKAFPAYMFVKLAGDMQKCIVVGDHGSYAQRFENFRKNEGKSNEPWWITGEQCREENVQKMTLL